VTLWLGHWTYDQKVVGLTPGRLTINWLLLLVWVTVCGQVNHLCITITKVNLVFRPSGVGN